jgi:ribosome-associated translation inhibitor RaiA
MVLFDTFLLSISETRGKLRAYKAAMRIKISAANREIPASIAGQITRQLQLSLARFDGLVVRADVAVRETLSHQECGLRLQLRAGEDVVIRERHPELILATRRAAQRAARTLDRQLTLHRAAASARRPAAAGN